MARICALFLVVVLTTQCLGLKRYDGYTVYRVSTEDTKVEETIRILEEGAPGSIEFWRYAGPGREAFDFMASPDIKERVESFLKISSSSYSVIMENVQNFIEEQQPASVTPYLTGNLASFDYDKYHTNDEINSWMFDFASANPSLVTLEENIGSSYEGRTLRALKIGVQKSGKKAIWFQGGIHAREWISPATMINLARYFVEDYINGDEDVKNFLETYDIYIMPVLNPDGYVFSWTDDRMWRKNRNPEYSNRKNCYGVDLNRNYDYAFGGEGASPNQCTTTYHGPNALSEPETASTALFLTSLQNELNGIEMFIDFHSYGQLWMWAWGYKVGLLTEDHDQQMGLCLAAASEIKNVDGTSYTCQVSANMYAAAGASEDFGYGTLGVKYSYVVELPPLTSFYGFLLPERFIAPTGVETYAGVKAAIKYAMMNP